MTDHARIRLGIIGLGAMGTEMLSVAVEHPDFDVVRCADPSTHTLDRVRRAYPGIAMTSVPDDLIGDPGLDALYIAAPPVWHAHYAIAAMAAGMAVLCEKPLAISVDDGEAMQRAARQTGAVNALNFPFSDRHAALEVQRAVRAGEHGEALAVEMRFTFPHWPRAFQRDASWLAGREQGGFLREVASHYLFLTDRVIGPMTPEYGALDAAAGVPGAAESAALGLFRSGDVPVRLSGQVAAVPECYEWTLYGTRRSYRITDWAQLSVGDEAGWAPVTLTGARGTEHTRLGEFASAIRGGPSALADFAAGLRVQRLVEFLHGVVGGGADGAQ